MIKHKTKQHTSEAHPASKWCVGAVAGVVRVTFLTGALVETRIAGTFSHTACTREKFSFSH